MENKIISQETPNITSREVIEAMEQVRMGFTASRIALSACTLLYPLKKLGEKWGNEFTKIQAEYHQFLLDTYKGFEEELQRLQKEEKEEKDEDTEVNDSLPHDVLEEILNTPYKAEEK